MLRIICGPTGAGKSAVAMAIAERHGLTIVSADSRQIYRGFDVGTSKPTAADRGRVPHLGIDVADPHERWSAARWADDAARWIDDAGPDRVLVVGGTGLYLKALTAPFFDEPALDPAQRVSLAAALDTLSVPALRSWVERLDPQRAHLGRTQLLRAVEVALLTGRRLSDLHQEAARPPRYSARWLVVDTGAGLEARISARLDAMLAGGWIEETRTLAAHVAVGAPAWQACGYAAVRTLALGAAEPASVRTTILVETRQYAKRQRTWFRNQLAGADVTRLDPRAPGAGAAADAWWRSEDGT